MDNINWFDDKFVKQLVFDLMLENHQLRCDLVKAAKDEDFWRDAYLKLNNSVDAE